MWCNICYTLISKKGWNILLSRHTPLSALTYHQAHLHNLIDQADLNLINIPQLDHLQYLLKFHFRKIHTSDTLVYAKKFILWIFTSIKSLLIQKSWWRQFILRPKRYIPVIKCFILWMGNHYLWIFVMLILFWEPQKKA